MLQDERICSYETSQTSRDEKRIAGSGFKSVSALPADATMTE
jgi:hypothetical protein